MERVNSEIGSKKPDNWREKTDPIKTAVKIPNLIRRAEERSFGFLGEPYRSVPSSKEPNGHIQPQKKRPNTIVNRMINKAGNDFMISVRADKEAEIPINGSNRKKKSTGIQETKGYIAARKQ